MRRRPPGLRWLEVAVVLAVVAGVSLVLLQSLSPAPRVSRPPDESDRVVHPQGYSIIRPVDTEVHVSTEPSGDSLDLLRVTPGGPGRYNTSVTVARLAEAPDTRQLQEREGFRLASFQGQEAWVRVGDSGKYVEWVAVFHRGGQWFRLRLSEPAVHGRPPRMPPPLWVPYLDSFQTTK